MPPHSPQLSGGFHYKIMIWKNLRKQREYNRKYYSVPENRKRKQEYDRKYARTIRKNRRKQRRLLDSKFRLDSNMATVIYQALRKRKNGRSWEKLVGYTLENLINHLEKQFDNKMIWQNYGSYWVIDHIIPQVYFNYQSAEDKKFKKCWALKNLRPLEKIENLKKGKKVGGL